MEKVILTNPAVQDVVVQGFNVEGVGQIPRAYVTVKSGYMVSADDLVQYANSRVALTGCKPFQPRTFDPENVNNGLFNPKLFKHEFFNQKLWGLQTLNFSPPKCMVWVEKSGV